MSSPRQVQVTSSDPFLEGKIYGENCMSVYKVLFWCRKFTYSRTKVYEEQRNGTPSPSDQVIAKVQTSLRVDWRTTIRYLILRVPEICPDSVHKILSEKLSYNKVCVLDATFAYSCFQVAACWSFPEFPLRMLKVLKNSFTLTLPTMKRGATTLLRKRKEISPAAPHHLQ